MFQRYGVKPSKGMSAVSMIVGVVFVFIGISQISQMGFFGVIWTLVALAITGYHAANVFSQKGVSVYEVDAFANHEDQKSSTKNYEEKLRQLHRLKEDNIISSEEYEKKKEELLKEKW
jgi:hypothetical protein